MIHVVRHGESRKRSSTGSPMVSDRAGYVYGAALAVSGGWDREELPMDHDGDVTALFRDEAADV